MKKSNQIRSFEDHAEVLKYGKKLRFDFFLSDLRVLIEYDGEQHFKPAWGGTKTYHALIENDSRKDIWAQENSYRLIRIRFDDIHRIEEILSVNLVNNPQQIVT